MESASTSAEPASSHSSDSLVRMKVAVDALEKASSDTEKLSALFVVAKVVKPELVEKQQLIQLFQSIDWKFLYRMLKTSNNSDEALSQAIYQTIAVSVLASFYKTIAQDIDRKISVKLLKEMVRIVGEIKDKEFDEKHQMTEDICTCLESFISTLEYESDKEWIEELFESKFTSLFLELTNDVQMNSVFNVLSQTSVHCRWALLDPLSFNDYMTSLAKEFKADQSEKKFEICKNISVCVRQNSTGAKNFSKWVDLVFDGLFDIFRSKLNKKLRDPAFDLAATLTEVYGGYFWLDSGQWQGPTRKFFTLLTALSCVEIKLNLESETVDLDLVANCFVLLEHSIVTLTSDDNQQLIDAIAPQEMFNLLNTIKETMSILIDHLHKLSLQIDQIDQTIEIFPLAVASIRVLCVWIAEETEALRDEIAKILPFIVKIVALSSTSRNSFGLSVCQVVLPAMYSLCLDDQRMQTILKQENFGQLLAAHKNFENSSDVYRGLKGLLGE